MFWIVITSQNRDDLNYSTNTKKNCYKKKRTMILERFRERTDKIIKAKSVKELRGFIRGDQDWAKRNPPLTEEAKNQQEELAALHVIGMDLLYLW
jgi:hypothetical protein